MTTDVTDVMPIEPVDPVEPRPIEELLKIKDYTLMTQDEIDMVMDYRVSCATKDAYVMGQEQAASDALKRMADVYAQLNALYKAQLKDMARVVLPNG